MKQKKYQRPPKVERPRPPCFRCKVRPSQHNYVHCKYCQQELASEFEAKEAEGKL